ncbi:MAG: glycosyltransferase [Wolinella sp.]
MKRILIFHFHNHKTQPRVRREYEALCDSYDVYGLGYTPNALAKEFYQITKPKWTLKMRLIQRFWLLFRCFEHVYWRLPQVMAASEILAREKFDIIIAHDAETLPVALKFASGAKVIANMHEYAPREFESYFWWRFYFAPYKEYLCRTYLNKADSIHSVSHALAHEYQKNYNIKCDVLMSLPTSKAIQLETHDSSQIRLIHHGLASADRRIEGMIEMMDYLDSRFSLDLMLVETNQIDYFQKLKKMASSRKNIRLIPPVKFEEIVPFTSKYDIGIFLCPPTTFNLKYCLPNKFFEFIQACLAIAIGPSPEMARILKDENLGVISKDFTPKSMAETLNSLTRAQIEEFRQNADRAARIYTAEANSIKLREIVEGVLCAEDGQ